MSPLFDYVSIALPQRLHTLAQDPSLDYKSFVLYFGLLVTSWEIYLVLRQLPLYSKDPPKNLTKHLTREKLNKSQAYGRDKAYFSLFQLVYSQLLGLAFLLGDVYPRAWELSARAVGAKYDGGILHSMLFGTVLTLTAYLPTIPPSLYQTFVLEEKHGFNKTTLGLFFADMLKTQLVTAALGLPLLAGFLKVIDWAGDSFVLYLMAFLIVFQLFVATIFPTVIQPLFNKFVSLPDGEVRDKVVALSKRLNFPLTHLYEIDGSKRSSHSNAYYFGLPWSKRIVIYDTLIKHSKPEEVEAVLAHELGHWALVHPTKMLAVTQLHLLLTLTLIHLFLGNPVLLSSFNFPRSTCANPPVMIAFLLSQLVMGPIDSAMGVLVNAITRKYEYEADRFACELGEDLGKALARSLETLHAENSATVNTDWLYSAYHHNHPTLPERLRAIEAFNADYYGANKHLKVKPSVKSEL